MSVDIKLEMGDVVNGKRILSIEGEGLNGTIEVDVVKIGSARNLGYLIRQIGDGLMLSPRGGGGRVDPVLIRERQSAAFRAPRSRSRR